LAREEYVCSKFPTSVVVKDAFLNLHANVKMGDFKNPMKGLPTGKGVWPITNGLVDYDLDDRSYIHLPVVPGRENENACLLLGTDMNPVAFGDFYIRVMFAHMTHLCCVSEMSPFVAHWPLVKGAKKGDGNKLLPMWRPNPDWHIVMRDFSLLAGGMCPKPPSSLGFYNRVLPQPLHRDDDSLLLEGRDPASPFYRRGEERRGLAMRPHTGIFPIFEDEKRTVALYHPRNRKEIWYNRLLAFDGSTEHCGITHHPCQVITSDAGEDDDAKLAVVEQMMQNRIDAHKKRTCRI
jgi:hypothetical protein